MQFGSADRKRIDQMKDFHNHQVTGKPRVRLICLPFEQAQKFPSQEKFWQNWYFFTNHERL